MTAVLPRTAALGIVVACHAAAAMLLLDHSHARKTFPESAPIMVRLVAPAPISERVVERTMPNPVRRQHVQPVARPPEPLIAAAEASAPAFEPTVQQALTAPAPVAPAPAPVIVADVTAPSSAEPVVPPTFSAAYLKNPAPAYPLVSRRIGEEGRVVLRVLVNDHGVPDRVELRTSSGHARLDEAAIDTVKHWKFVPAQRGTEALSAWVLVPISFNLRS